MAWTGLQLRALHAALQLPALFGRRSRPLRRAGPPRSRPRQARLARAAPGAADQGGVPLHDPRPLRHHREQRLVVDGDGLRRLAGDDGRRRAAEAPGLGHRDGPDPRRQGLRGASPTSSATRIISATWTSRSPARPRASPRCRWTSRSPASPRRSCKVALAQAKEGRAHILGEMAKALDHTREELSAHAPRIETMQIAKDEDPRHHRHRRQGDPRDRRRPPAPRSTSTTTA